MVRWGLRNSDFHLRKASTISKRPVCVQVVDRRQQPAGRSLGVCSRVVASRASPELVHAMGSARAARNARPLDTVLSTIRTKLGLHSAQHTCPMCYESFTDADGAKPATTLGCAHKVCTGCWSEWRKMQGAHAVCPLCRVTNFSMPCSLRGLHPRPWHLLRPLLLPPRLTMQRLASSATVAAAPRASVAAAPRASARLR